MSFECHERVWCANNPAETLPKRFVVSKSVSENFFELVAGQTDDIAYQWLFLVSGTVAVLCKGHFQWLAMHWTGQYGFP